MRVQSQIIKAAQKIAEGKRNNGYAPITHDLALVSQITEKIGIILTESLVEFSSTRDI